MELYRSRKVYGHFSTMVASSNVSLQLALLFVVKDIHLNLMWQLLAFPLAFFLTDFINGLVHMIMDHNENYDSFYGPLVANFHLHHQVPKYQRNALHIVYFNETGAKIWMVPVLLMGLVLIANGWLSPLASYTLVYTGILSSIAEVSHYLCHTSDSKIARFLARVGILLSREHHSHHHDEDNKNYAFLNGMSDPLINIIAKSFFTGYKTTTDKHFAQYISNYGIDSR